MIMLPDCGINQKQAEKCFKVHPFSASAAGDSRNRANPNYSLQLVAVPVQQPQVVLERIEMPCNVESKFDPTESNENLQMEIDDQSNSTANVHSLPVESIKAEQNEPKGKDKKINSPLEAARTTVENTACNGNISHLNNQGNGSNGFAAVHHNGALTDDGTIIVLSDDSDDEIASSAQSIATGELLTETEPFEPTSSAPTIKIERPTSPNLTAPLNTSMEIISSRVLLNMIGENLDAQEEVVLERDKLQKTIRQNQIVLNQNATQIKSLKRKLNVLVDSKNKLKKDMKEAHRNAMKKIKLEVEAEMIKMELECQQKIQEMERKMKRKEESLRKDAEIRIKRTLADITNTCNKHLLLASDDNFLSWQC